MKLNKKMKKILAFVLSLAMVVSTFSLTLLAQMMNGYLQTMAGLILLKTAM